MSAVAHLQSLSFGMSLLTLPPELLSNIFHPAHESSLLSASPICSHLYPFQQAALYRNVTFSSFKQFQLFLRTILSCDQVGGLVRHLKVPRHMEELDLPSGSIRQLLLRISKVESLDLGTMYGGIEAVVLRGSISPKILQNLKHLVIGGIPPQLTNGSDWLSQLTSAYPSLTSLDLGISDCLSLGTSHLSTVKSLILRNLYHQDLEIVRQICNRLPAVETLIIDAQMALSFGFQSILEDLSSSSSSHHLRSLTLLGKPTRLYLSTLALCKNHLISFKNLSYLYLGIESYYYHPEVGPLLRQLLHLKTLGFGYEVFLDEDQLEELAIGSIRIPALKKIILDQVKGKVGWSVREEGRCEELHPRHVESRYHIAPDWARPAFNPYGEDSFTVEGMNELIERLRGARVKVEGTIFKAFEVEREWQKEVKICAFIWSVIEEDALIAKEAEELNGESGLGDWHESLEGFDEGFYDSDS
ncbi:hypothetical protein JCM5353_007651 [Sporobolomyces roseus]